MARTPLLLSLLLLLLLPPHFPDPCEPTSLSSDTSSMLRASLVSVSAAVRRRMVSSFPVRSRVVTPYAIRLGIIDSSLDNVQSKQNELNPLASHFSRHDKQVTCKFVL
jgi:hypothetical protein